MGRRNHIKVDAVEVKEARRRYMEKWRKQNPDKPREYRENFFLRLAQKEKEQQKNEE